MDPLLERIQSRIREHELLRDGEPVVVGLSGGVDSVVVAEALLRLGYSLIAVHVNYQLRGEDADADEAFVRRWCDERGVSVEVRSFETEDIAENRGLSIQHVARELRYESFQAVAHEAGIMSVALGHHRDDQAETILLNLLRGTGLEGLAGMPVKRTLSHSGDVIVVRPLLELFRHEIEAFARRTGLTWREDVTNEKSAYRRGAIRSEILPLIESHFGATVKDRLARTADLVRAYLDATLDVEIRKSFIPAADSVDGEGALRLDALEAMPEVMRRRVIIEALRRWLPSVDASARAAEEIDALRLSQPGKRQEYGGGEVWREREYLLFLPGPPAREQEDAVLEPGGRAALSGGVIKAERLLAPPALLDSGNPNEVFIDARAVAEPLRIRKWQEGDKFKPLGMRHPKKLSDFLTDERVPTYRKKNVYVVVSEGRIVWVVGYRIAHDVRVKGDTTETLRLSYHPAENQAGA